MPLILDNSIFDCPHCHQPGRVTDPGESHTIDWEPGDAMATVTLDSGIYACDLCQQGYTVRIVFRGQPVGTEIRRAEYEPPQRVTTPNHKKSDSI